MLMRSSLYLLLHACVCCACSQFVELFLFDVNGRNVAASAAGATTSLSTTALGGGLGAAFGGDLLADPWVQSAASQYVSASCTGYSDAYTVMFPGGTATRISMAYFGA